MNDKDNIRLTHIFDSSVELNQIISNFESVDDLDYISMQPFVC